ncbi:FtsB family cell division protein [Brevibacterium litoralis]|uniref:FtsB family cell division protein n=1 Tax=Brevibacterium litoralis TaxID=3138935 RepID=UPI0032EEAD00
MNSTRPSGRVRDRLRRSLGQGVQDVQVGNRTGRIERPVVGLDPDRLDRTAAGRRFSLRTLVLVGLGILLVAMFAPSVNTGIRQWQQISALERDIAATEGEVEALQAKQEQLTDPAYLAARAREEQHYVKPGEELYIVIDDTGAADEADAATTDTDRVDVPVRDRPWYTELLDDLQAIGFTTEQQAAAREVANDDTEHE